MLKAVILAGGRGERLRPLTDTLPKPMLAVKGRPFLEYQLELFKKNGIREIVLCIGYLGERIREHFGDGSRLGLRIAYSTEEGFLGTGGALRLAAGLLPESFIVAYGDSYLPIDYAALAHFWSSVDAAALTVCYDNSVRVAPNNIRIDEQGLVKAYDKRHPGARMNYVEAGVTVLRKGVFDMVPAARVVSLEEDVFPELIRQGKLMGYPTSERYYDIGTPGGLRLIEEVL